MKTATHRTATLVLLPALLIVGASCSDSSGEPDGLETPAGSESTTELTTEPTTPAATSAPEPEPTDQPYEITFDVPEGLEFDLPEDVLAGTPEAQALDVFLRYSTARWTALTTNEVPDELPAVSAGPPMTEIQDRVANQAAEDFMLTGELVTTPVVEAASDSVAVVTGCVDQSAVMVIDAGTEREPEGGSPTYTFQADLSPRTGSTLMVTSYDIEEAAC